MRVTIGAFALCGALLASASAGDAAEWWPCELPDRFVGSDANAFDSYAAAEASGALGLGLSWCPADVEWSPTRKTALMAAQAHCEGHGEFTLDLCGLLQLQWVKDDRCACPVAMIDPELLAAQRAAHERREEAAAQAARIAEEEIARIASARPCEIPDYPNADPDAVPGLGFSWCPAEVDFQVRSYAIAVAGSYCAKLAGELGKDWAAQIASLCEGLDNLEGRRSESGHQCACPADIRQRD